MRNSTGAACTAEELKSLDKLAAGTDRPRAMEAFDGLAREGWRRLELEKSSAPVVAQWCNFVPDELVIAAGAIPLRLDTGCSAWLRPAEQLVPHDLCSVVRANAGAVVEPSWQLSNTDLVVAPTSCDGKKKLALLLPDDWRVHVLKLPPFDRGRRSMSWWYAEIERLVNRLQKLSGKRISRSSLKNAIELVNLRSSLVRQLNRLRSNPCLPVSGADAFFVMQTSFTAECAWWIEKTQVLITELEDRVSNHQGIRPKARILVTGSPILWPDYSLLFLLAQAGAEVVADEMCSATQRLYHPNVADEWTREAMIRAAADRVLLTSTCPCFEESDIRWDRLCELADHFQVDGVVHHTLRLCQLYDLDARRLANRFKEKKLPVLLLQTELGPKDDGRMRNRIEAFVEILLDR